jgi:MFS transporter, ACS family, glucarate transporter
METRPPHNRSWVIVFAVALAVLAYIDRVCISQAAEPISRDLGLTKPAMGLIFGAFALSYALFEIPSGWLGDRVGPRRVLIRIVLAWSTFTALTGAAVNFTSLWIIRFLFGAGEAGCFPNLTKAFSIWVPPEGRARAQGIVWAFARWGGAFTPPLVVFALRFMTWRTAFVTFAALGLIWAYAFARWTPPPALTGVSEKGDRLLCPQPTNPQTTAPALRWTERSVPFFAHTHQGGDSTPWRKLLTHRSVWLLCVQYFCVSFGWYFYITWLPTYLQEFRHLSPAEGAKLAILPLLFGGFGSLVSGWIATHAPSHRRSIAIFGMLAAAAFIIAVTRISVASSAMLAMGMASFSNDLAVPAAWHACMDIGGRFSGTVSGSMNTLGNLAGFVAPVFGGFLLDRTHGNWNALLFVMAAVYIAGAACWPFIDPQAPLEL